MPLYSEHKSNMYFSGSPTYNPYSSYSSPISSLGTSYSASYLNPGGSYTNHSSISSYSRPPLSSRWIPGLSRSYSPMLTSISERGTSSPVRINSPRRIPFSKRSYGTSSYTQRPININTADIDVSRDKYRRQSVETPTAVTTPCKAPLQKEPSVDEKEKSPFMPRVDGKPETGIDSSPGVKRNTITRGRTVVRLHTVKRRERDSPRKPIENVEPQDVQNAIVESSVVLPANDREIENNEAKSWRVKLSEDLNYPEKKEKKSLGTKFVETHLVKHDNNQAESKTIHNNSRIEITAQSLPTTLQPSEEVPLLSRTPDRRCSMELLAEQASVLDALIKGENLSTATAPLDLSKVGIAGEDSKAIIESIKRKKSNSQENPLKTTKSDHSLHLNLNSLRNSKDSKSFNKRRSLKKSFSGGSISRLDSITELPKDLAPIELPAIEEIQMSIKKDTADKKLQTKPKTKIIASVDISPPASPLKFRIENIIVEEKVHLPKHKKEITFSSTVEDTLPHDATLQSPLIRTKERHSIKRKSKNISDPTSPEPEDGNFWDKIGKRETVYLMKRKQNLDEVREKSRRAIFWYPENGELVENTESNDVDKTDILSEISDSSQLVVEKNIDKNELDLPMEHITKSENVVMSNVNNSAEQELKEDISNKHEPDIIIKNEIEEKQEKKTEDSKKVKNPKPGSKSKLKLVPNIDEFKTSSQPDNTESSGTKDLRKSSEGVEINKPVTLDLKTEPKEDIILVTNITESKIKAPNNNNEIENESPMTVDNINSFEKTLSVKESGLATKDSLNILKLEQHDKLTEEIYSKLPSNNEIKGAVNQDFKEKVITKTANSLSNTDKKPEIKVFELREEGAVDVNENIVTPLLSPETDTKSNKAKSKDSAPKKLIHAKSSKVSNKKPAANTSTKFKEIKMVQICPIHGEINKTDDRSPSNTTKNDAELTTSVSEIILSAESNTSAPVDLLPKTEEKPTLATPPAASVELSNDTPSKTELQLPKVLKSENIPKISTPTDAKNVRNDLDVEKKIEEPKSDTKIEQGNVIKQLSLKNNVPFVAPSPKKPVKEEKALKPLIATPRPLQKRVPQVIHSSESSDSSSEEESSEEDEESESSEESTEFYECENNADGRTSTGSNDSGFDSSAPTSPATFMQIKKGAESPGPSSSNATSQLQATDISEQELEQSTAYGIFRKTGRFTPPARSIPRFRKYTIEDFQFIKVLGKGSFGKVLLAELRDTEYYYAVKCLKKDVVLEDDDVECTLIERKVLALGTNHPYLCHLFATFQTDSHLFFVMEYLNGGDLMFHIQQSGRFPEARARFYAAEIVSGLKFLHKRGIVYRDLKLDNILLDFDGHVRIADFGMCKLQIYLEKTADTFCGTPDYMAPEIIKGLKYNQTVDWWSFGVLLYEMLIGQSPFSGCDEDELFWSICNEMPSYPRFLSQQALTILTRLLDKDARTRLGGVECMHGDIRDQDFFHQIPWERLERRDLEAPFRPRVRHPLDTQYFDRAFTGERPRLTAVEPQVLRSMDQEPFRGFSYTNPNATDR